MVHEFVTVTDKSRDRMDRVSILWWMVMVATVIMTKALRFIKDSKKFDCAIYLFELASVMFDSEYVNLFIIVYKYFIYHHLIDVNLHV